MNIDREKLGEVVRSLREQKQLSRKELAERVGVSQHAIRYIERGERAPSMESINLIGEALGVPAGALALLGSRFEGRSVRGANLLDSVQNAIEELVSLKSLLESESKAKLAANETTA